MPDIENIQQKNFVANTETGEGEFVTSENVNTTISEEQSARIKTKTKPDTSG